MSKKAPRRFFFCCGSCNNSCRLGALEQQHYFLKPLGIMMFFFDNFGFVLCFRTLIPKCLSSLANFLLLSGRMVFHHPIGRTTLGSGVKNDTIIYLTTFPQKQQKTIEEIRCQPSEHPWVSHLSEFENYYWEVFRTRKVFVLGLHENIRHHLRCLKDKVAMNWTKTLQGLHS